jgi:hypothetical protein
MYRAYDKKKWKSIPNEKKLLMEVFQTFYEHVFENNKEGISDKTVFFDKNKLHDLYVKLQLSLEEEE